MNLTPRCNLAELADNQPVAVEFVVMQYVFLKVGIAEIREVADDNVRVSYCRLDIGNGVAAPYGKNRVRIRLHKLCFLVATIHDCIFLICFYVETFRIMYGAGNSA